jgi:regulatory protein YycH of two-component signal transduction system YycFG
MTNWEKLKQKLLSAVRHLQDHREHAKSLILVLLVCFSLLLTWNLGSYQPRLEVIKNQNTIENVRIAEDGDRKVVELVKPSQILLETEGQTRGILDREIFNKIYEKLTESRFINDEYQSFRSIENMQEPEEYIEFVFPTKLSPNLLRQLFRFAEQPSWFENTDRFYLYQRKTRDITTTYARFISYEDKRFMDLEIQYKYSNTKQAMLNEETTQPFTHVELENSKGELNKIVYLPQGDVVVSSPLKFVRIEEATDFKRALFGDPNFVQEEENEASLVFTDGKQALTVSKNDHTMSFISMNPGMVDEMNTNRSTITESVSFVSKHSGWTDNYILFDQKGEDSVIFRMQLEGYPVFNDLGEIELDWENGQVYEYNRSLINLEYDYQIEDYNRDLQNQVSGRRSLKSAEEVLEILEANVGMDKVKDIKIGFEMDQVNNSGSFLIYEFIPGWYYNNGYYWIALDNIVPLGGKGSGLEAN